MTTIPLPAAARPSRSAPAATSGRWWLLGFAVVALLTLARLPVVLAEVRRSVEERIAAGDLPSTDQRSLAVAIGVSAAVAIVLVMTLLIMTVARRLEPRCRLPRLQWAARSIPALPYLVIGVAAAVQGSALLIGALHPRQEWAVWAVATAVPLAGAVALLRSGTPTSALVRYAVAAGVVVAVSLVL